MAAEASVLDLPHIESSARVASLINRVLRAVTDVSGASVRAFGSSVNGFGDEASDIDLLVAASKIHLVDGLNLGKLSDHDLAPRTLAFLQTRLRKQGFRIDEKVLHAKVPILKMSFNGMACDLSVNNLLPVFNTRLLKNYADLDRRAVEVTIACKRWAREHDVHGAPLGNFSSYAFTLMVIFFMQVRGVLPCLQKNATDRPLIYREGATEYNVAMDEVPPVGTWSPSDVDINFKEFVLFYCDEFKWGTSVVSIRTGTCADVASYKRLGMKRRNGVSDRQWAEMLHIEDPFNVERNLNCVLGPGSNEKLWWALDEERATMGLTDPHVRPPKVNPSPLRRRWKPGGDDEGQQQPDPSSINPDPFGRTGPPDPSSINPDPFGRTTYKKGNKIPPAKA